MAHAAQRDFTIDVKNRLPEYFRGRKVLDCGSLNINGDNRFLFEQCDYLGIDVCSGTNVDVVTLIHEHEAEDGSYDVVISTEALEHDRHWRLSLQKMLRVLKPGGLLVLTCATTGRPPHFYGPSEWGEYYANLSEEDIRSEISIETAFASHEFRVEKMRSEGDLYFWGIKR